MTYIAARFLFVLAICVSWSALGAQITTWSSCEQDERLGGDPSNPFSDLPKACGISFTGRIERGDADKIRTIVERLKALTRHSGGLSAQVRLSSIGGDVGEAIRIGRIIRGNALTTMVSDATCVSACVLVLASGVDRLVLNGRIGIHSPYAEALAGGESYEKLRQRRDVRNEAIRNYLQEMDIPEALLAAMNRIPSDQVRWLDHRELRDLQLVGEDAAWREWQAANKARKLGISHSEFVARKAQVRNICRGGPTYSGCEERILRGN